MNSELIPNLIKDYNSGISMAQCCKTYHTTPQTMRKILSENNIRIRSAGEQTAIRNSQNRNEINDNYFSTLTLENSYYLGFLAADGTIRPNRNEIKIGLKQDDDIFLKEFAKKLQYKGEVHYYSGNQSAELRFSSAKIKKDLEKYSIVPNKTYIGITMKNIPDEFKIAFIKGFFDGDGSFSFSEKTKQCSIKIVSHTKGILEEIQNFISQKTYLYQDSRGLYSLEFSTKQALSFLAEIYELNTPKLQRKYDKYLEALTLRI